MQSMMKCRHIREPESCNRRGSESRPCFVVRRWCLIYIRRSHLLKCVNRAVTFRRQMDTASLLSIIADIVELLHTTVVPIAVSPLTAPFIMETQCADSSQPTARGRGGGRGKSRGGLGKYLRARGRGRGGGRPAEFGKRLVLEDEEELDPNSEEAAEAREFQQKFSKRQLGSNADRYAEPEPVLDSDGMAIVYEYYNPFVSDIFSILGKAEIEPEVDLSFFLERQRLLEASAGPSSAPAPPEEEVDESLAHISSRPRGPSQSKKGRIQTIEWDESLDQMTREKAAAEATWGDFISYLMLKWF